MLKFNLTDIDELLEKVRHSYSKTYLNEAIISYRSGAYRSSIITTWIAVCIDIIEKIRELDTNGDKAAQSINAKLISIQDNNIAGMLNFEKNILEYACHNLQIISPIEKVHLERLREDRNICAHPTFSSDGSQFNPSPELARTYIVQASNYLLIHPPSMGKAILDRLERLITEPSFPSDEEGAFTVLSSDAWLGRARESTIRNFFIILLKRLYINEEPIKLDLYNKIISSIAAVRRLSVNTYNDVISKKINSLLENATDKILLRFFILLYSQQHLWNIIDKSVKTRIQCLIKIRSSEELIICKIPYLASIFPELHPPFMQKFNELDKKE